MKKITVFSLFFAIFCTFSTMFAEDDEDKFRLAVMEFEDKSGKLSTETLSNATEYIRGAFVASNEFIVIAKERQENAMIKQMKKESYKACNDKNCQIPLGQALSADTILKTTITFFAKKYTITSELIDLAKEATTKGAKATFDGSEESLNEALDKIVSQIIGKKNQNIKKTETIIENQKRVEESQIAKVEKFDPEKPIIFDGLQWSNKAPQQMNWKEAVNYCKNLNESGRSDWRLPNIDELRTLIINHDGTKTGGTCKISEKAGKLSSNNISTTDCVYGRTGSNFSKLGDSDWFWSSSIMSDNNHYAFRVFFTQGTILQGSNDDLFKHNVRCVR